VRGGGRGNDARGAERLRGLLGGPMKEEEEGAGSAFSAPGTTCFRRGEAAGVTLARIRGAVEGKESESRGEELEVLRSLTGGDAVCRLNEGKF